MHVCPCTLNPFQTACPYITNSWPALSSETPSLACSLLPLPLLRPCLTPPPASGVLCYAADHGSILSTFLGDDFVSSSMDVNSMTAEQLQQPLEIDATCYGVATATFDIA